MKKNAKTGVIVPLMDGTKAAAAQLAKLVRRGHGPAGIEDVVRDVLESVRRDGDAAVARFTKKFDGVSLVPRDFEIPKSEIEAARRRVPKQLIQALESAHARIRAFHLREKQTGFEKKERGIRTGMRVTPLARAGVYVPGGKAAYPSSVLMNIVPAAVAGVSEITVVTPPSKAGVRDAVLAAAAIAGATRVLRIGGAQAVAALAYGTKTVARVDKIVGPGNIYVATAKRLVFGEVDIDMIAGPSEVLIIADASADPEWIAADMLAQAEHDELAAAICITTDADHGRAVAEAVARQCAELPRAAIAATSIANYGTILVAPSLERACELSEEIAPEHLEIATKTPRRLVPLLRNAGAIFVGALSTEPLGDYAAGPNHVLPTGGAARFSSPLGVYDFVKRTSIIEVDRSGLSRLAPAVVELAMAEGLDAHAAAVLRRMNNTKTRPRARSTGD
ncbi:MAG TPA: histidinol dehydrogenase [Candidatus Binatia bacterium]|jgi:histidinol dehydrogenase